MYKQNGSSIRVVVRRRDLHDVDYVKIVLRQAGLNPIEIEKFIAEETTP